FALFEVFDFTVESRLLRVSDDLLAVLFVPGLSWKKFVRRRWRLRVALGAELDELRHLREDIRARPVLVVSAKAFLVEFRLKREDRVFWRAILPSLDARCSPGDQGR